MIYNKRFENQSMKIEQYKCPNLNYKTCGKYLQCKYIKCMFYWLNADKKTQIQLIYFINKHL